MRFIVCGVPRTGTECLAKLLGVFGLKSTHQQRPEPAEFVQRFPYELMAPPPCVREFARLAAYQEGDATASHSLIWYQAPIQWIRPEVRFLLPLRDPRTVCSSWLHLDREARVRKVRLEPEWYAESYRQAYAFALEQARVMPTPPVWYDARGMFHGEYLDALCRYVGGDPARRQAAWDHLKRPTNHRGSYPLLDDGLFDGCRKTVEVLKAELEELTWPTA